MEGKLLAERIASRNEHGNHLHREKGDKANSCGSEWEQRMKWWMYLWSLAIRSGSIRSGSIRLSRWSVVGGCGAVWWWLVDGGAVAVYVERRDGVAVILPLIQFTFLHFNFQS